MRVDVAAGTQLHGLHSMRGSPSAILRMTAMDSKPIDILLARGGRSRVRCDRGAYHVLVLLAHAFAEATVVLAARLLAAHHDGLCLVKEIICKGLARKGA